MDRIANTNELVAELKDLLRYVEAPRPSRARVAASLTRLGRRLTAVKGDPYWMRAKFPGKADDGTPFRRGEEVLYWPLTKTIMVGRKADAAWRQFESEIEDEAVYSGHGGYGDY